MIVELELVSVTVGIRRGKQWKNSMKWISLKFSFVALCLIGLLVSSPSLAGTNQLIDPTSTGEDFPTKNLGPNTTLAIFNEHLNDDGGGVFIDGSFTFYVKTDGVVAEVPVSSIELVRTADRGLALRHETEMYPISFHAGAECPLAKFIHRGGKLLFSVPPNVDERTLADLGLERSSRYSQDIVYIAKEFAQIETVDFTPLLHEMDFFNVRTVWVLPILSDSSPEFSGNVDPRVSRFVQKLQREVKGITRQGPLNSYFNVMEDEFMQIMLESGEGQLKFKAAPLRVYWMQGDFSTVILRLDFMDMRTITERDLWTPGDAGYVGQYDVLIMYYFAGILKTFQLDAQNSKGARDFEHVVQLLCD